MAQPTTPIVAAATGAVAAGSGKTTIVDPVVAKIAGIAAREVQGVHALGGGAERAFGSIREAVGSSNLAQGVRVEVGETQVAADLTIVVDYPRPLQEVAAAVRSAVSDAITQLVGLEVAEINVTVTDVYIPGDDQSDDDKARVQ